MDTQWFKRARREDENRERGGNNKVKLYAIVHTHSFDRAKREERSQQQRKFLWVLTNSRGREEKSERGGNSKVNLYAYSVIQGNREEKSEWGGNSKVNLYTYSVIQGNREEKRWEVKIALERETKNVIHGLVVEQWR